MHGLSSYSKKALGEGLCGWHLVVLLKITILYYSWFYYSFIFHYFLKLFYLVVCSFFTFILFLVPVCVLSTSLFGILHYLYISIFLDFLYFILLSFYYLLLYCMLFILRLFYVRFVCVFTYLFVSSCLFYSF